MDRNRQVRRGGGRVFCEVKALLFPPACIGCGDLLPWGETDTVFCPACQREWDIARMEVAVEAAESAVAGHAYLAAYHAGRADGISERLIYHLKHKGEARAFDFAARALAVGVHTACLSDPRVDPAMPPLYTYPPRRKSGVREDGFDQAARLARALARCMEGEYVSAFRRTRTREIEQKTLDAQDRAQNAACAYALHKGMRDRLAGRTVVLCDDLATTGATLAACRDLLMEAGTATVLFATVGRTK